MMALFLGVQYWDYHICVMGTEVTAQHSRMVDSLPISCFLFSLLLTSSLFPILFSCSHLVFLCPQLFVPVYLSSHS